MNLEIYTLLLAICVFGLYGNKIFDMIGTSRNMIVDIAIAFFIIVPLCRLAVMAVHEAVKCSRDNFMFEVTPEKKCDGGAYMYSSDPERQKLCAQFSKDDLRKYECSPGEYHGRPVWRQGVLSQNGNAIGNGTLSNANWQNTTCGI
jgi:hypothetical protein